MYTYPKEYTEQEDALIVKTFKENAFNCKAAIDKLIRLLPDRSRGALEQRWYGKLRNTQTAYKLVDANNKTLLTNRKTIPRTAKNIQSGIYFTDDMLLALPIETLKPVAVKAVLNCSDKQKLLNTLKTL